MEIAVDDFATCGGTTRKSGAIFHLPLEWQREYRPLLADWFIRRNRDRVAALDRTINVWKPFEEFSRKDLPANEN